MKSILPITMVAILALSTTQADAQLDISKFGKSKQAGNSILSPGGAAPSLLDNLNPFKGNSPVLTFDRPISAVERFNENTQRVLEQTREAITKPIRNIQDMDLWPNNAPENATRSFSLVPEWLKTSRAEPVKPTTIADWVQPNPQ